MNRLLMIIVCLALTLVCAPNALAAASPPSPDEKAMLAKINQARAARGLPRLRFEGRLQRVARWMNRDMITHRRFDHSDSLRRDPFQRLDDFRYTARSYRGENLAAGNKAVAASYRQWWNSPGHRANMLNRNYRYVGIARMCDDKSVYGCYWTTEFGGHWTEGFRS